MGELSGCKKCDKVFEQSSGGFVGTPGGEVWTESLWTYTSFQKHKERDKKGDANSV